MKLHELFEDAESYQDFQDKVYGSPKRKVLGRGRENTAYEKQGRQDIYKVGQSNEGGSVFLKAIAQSAEARANPYLPKVKATRSINGGLQVSVVERLIPMSSLTKVKDVLGIIAMLHGKQRAKDAKSRLRKDFPESLHIKDLSGWIAENLSWYISQGEPTGPGGTVKDPHFFEAIAFIKAVRKQAKKLGLHVKADSYNVDNFMLRKTPDGYQLVLSDPLTSNKYAK